MLSKHQHAKIVDFLEMLNITSSRKITILMLWALRIFTALFPYTCSSQEQYCLFSCYLSAVKTVS